MAAEFPLAVYRCPGPHWGPGGSTYESATAYDDGVLNEMLVDGWCVSLEKAANPDSEPKEDIGAETKVASQYDRPSIKDLKKKAKELGLSIRGRQSYDGLMDAIGRKLAEQTDELD